MLKGKTALVTGSTSGIGLGIAKALAAQGANVMLNGFGDVEAAKAEVAAWGGRGLPRRRHEPARRDRRDDPACQSQFGALDILVNNAGIQHVAPVDDFPVERWDAIIAINLSSAFHTTRLALPGMKARGWGRIINVASVHGLVASANKSAYVAAKHGIIGLTKTTALETATTGVTANAICPGWVLTPLVQKQVDAAPRPKASPTRKPSAACWPRRSPRCSSPRPRSWARWRCSCARPPPTTCAAPPSTWTAAGWRSERPRIRLT
jgi:3-hydroxybutyrate dehydrogenase